MIRLVVTLALCSGAEAQHVPAMVPPCEGEALPLPFLLSCAASVSLRTAATAPRPQGHHKAQQGMPPGEQGAPRLSRPGSDTRPRTPSKRRSRKSMQERSARPSTILAEPGQRVRRHTLSRINLHLCPSRSTLPRNVNQRHASPQYSVRLQYAHTAVQRVRYVPPIHWRPGPAPLLAFQHNKVNPSLERLRSSPRFNGAFRDQLARSLTGAYDIFFKCWPHPDHATPYTLASHVRLSSAHSVHAAGATHTRHSAFSCPSREGSNRWAPPCPQPVRRMR